MPKIAAKVPGFAIYITMVLGRPTPTERVVAGGMSLVKLGELWWLLGGAELIHPPTRPIAARRVGDGTQIPSALFSFVGFACSRPHTSPHFPLSTVPTLTIIDDSLNNKRLLHAPHLPPSPKHTK